MVDRSDSDDDGDLDDDDDSILVDYFRGNQSHKNQVIKKNNGERSDTSSVLVRIQVGKNAEQYLSKTQLEEFIFEKKFQERFKNIAIFLFCIFLSAMDWLYFQPQLDRFVQAFDLEEIEGNSDNFLLSYVILAVYPIVQFPMQYVTEYNIKVALILAEISQVLGYGLRIIMMNMKGSRIAVLVFVSSQSLNTVGVAIVLSLISKLVSDWFPFSERIWALVACMAMFLLGALFIFLQPLLFDAPALEPGQTAAQMRAAKALMAWDIKLMHFIMVSLHFGCLIVVSLFFKRLFVDRRGNLHNCKDEWSDGDDESVLVTDRGSVRTGYTKASFGSRQTKTSHARSYGNKIINRIELSNRDMEQLLLKQRQEYLLT